MTIYENNCVGCDYCVRCGRSHQAVRVCDRCHDSSWKFYDFDGEELCAECLENKIKSEINNDFSGFIRDCFDELCEYFEIEEIEE